MSLHYCFFFFHLPLFYAYDSVPETHKHEGTKGKISLKTFLKISLVMWDQPRLKATTIVMVTLTKRHLRTRKGEKDKEELPANIQKVWIASFTIVNQ